MILDSIIGFILLCAAVLIVVLGVPGLIIAIPLIALVFVAVVAALDYFDRKRAGARS